MALLIIIQTGNKLMHNFVHTTGCKSVIQRNELLMSTVGNGSQSHYASKRSQREESASNLKPSY